MTDLKFKGKVLIICGPTATGKTDLGVFLAKKFNGEIISADSRQVYKGMDLGTGKFSKNDKVEKFDGKIKLPQSYDLGIFSPSLRLPCRQAGRERNPSEAKSLRFHPPAYAGGFSRRGIKLNDIFVHLVDVCDPKKQFSVFDFQKNAFNIIEKLWKENKLPIIVGGTGFYIKSLFSPIESLDIPADYSLRAKLEKKSIDELYKELFAINPQKATSLNESDRKNPRRLIRAIEISKSKISASSPKKILETFLEIGLSAQKNFLFELIDGRVDKRLEEGMIEEVKKLIDDSVSYKRLDDLGLEYRWISRYLSGKIGKEEMVQRLKNNIHDYARRQIIWFKKDQKIQWFDIEKEGFEKEVEKKVEKWLNMAKADDTKN